MNHVKRARTIASLLGVALLLGVSLWGVAATRHKQRAERRQTEAAAWLVSLQKGDEWQKRARLFNTRKASAAQIFARADRVEAFYLTGEPFRPTRRGGERGEKIRFLGGAGDEKSRKTGRGAEFYAIKGKEQGPEFARRLGAVVLDPHSYPLPGQSGTLCYIEPGMVFRVRSGKQFVDVFLCFHCNQLAVFEDNPHLPEDTIGGWLTGRFAVAGDFDAIRPQLAALAKEAFPNQGEVAAL